jgi:RNA polymerase sigma-70 factor (ECF subfamily)
MLQRPALHRYCSRMTGSVTDGEDAVQDTMLKVVQSFRGFAALNDPKAWLFRVAHNASMDVLRARAKAPESMTDDALGAVADRGAVGEETWVAKSALRYFMWLTPAERSCVILMDVLGYSLQEIAEISGRTVLSVKAALHRGRSRLKEVAEGEAMPPPLHTLEAHDLMLLELYTQRFNLRDFDGVRALLGEEVRLDLVGRVKWSGKPQVSRYVHNYCDSHDWALTPGIVDGLPAAIAYGPADPNREPIYFVLLKFGDGLVQRIQDYRYARYAMEMVELTVVHSAVVSESSFLRH